ncbi:MAG: hypothetical protein EGP81_05330 [Bacteroides clarus]|jgi:hypothetical protein|uniref:hypothetical protein n=1 Tax=Bacteroides clarus TaxID=626929 RepID=UPI00241E830E|nr:hypothetical protein [Bacteroides clarus]MBD9144967.1 hypothetical protein [Bacteroides clarus]
MDIQEIKLKKEIAEREIANILERIETETGLKTSMVYAHREKVESEVIAEPEYRVKVDITLVL